MTYYILPKKANSVIVHMNNEVMKPSDFLREVYKTDRTFILARRAVVHESVNEPERTHCCEFCVPFSHLRHCVQVASERLYAGSRPVTLTHSKIVLIKDVPL